MSSKTIAITSLGVSIISFAFCLFALVRCLPTVDVRFDYLGVIIGILSLLVTTLIGWQIYTIINIDRLVAKAIDKKEEIYSRQIPMELGVFFADNFWDYLPRLEVRIENLKTGISLNIPGVLDYSFEEVYSFLLASSTLPSSIPAEKRDSFVQAVAKGEHPLREKVINLLLELPVTNP